MSFIDALRERAEIGFKTGGGRSASRYPTADNFTYQPIFVGVKFTTRDDSDDRASSQASTTVFMIKYSDTVFTRVLNGEEVMIRYKGQAFKVVGAEIMGNKVGISLSCESPLAGRG